MPSQNAAIRLLLVDGHILMREGLRVLFKLQEDIELVGEASDVTAAFELVQSKHPNVILFNPQLVEPGVSLISQFLTLAPEAKVILMTGLADSDLERQAVQLGAMGVFRTDQSIDLLVRAVEKVHAGEAWLNRATVANVLRGWQSTKEPEAEAAIAKLSDREREIISLVGQGLRNKDIGERLGISEVTVRHHLTNIFTKLDVADRLELIIFAYRYKLAQPPA